MSSISVTPLGAGQDVGRSCLLVSIGEKRIMLDCGMHMGFQDERRFPDFSYVARDEALTEHIDCVIISHFHLDHCGALPYMTEMVGYNGPIYMTHPTKAIAPILLEDMRHVAVDLKGETNFFTSAMIKECMKKVIAVNLHQIIQVDDELEIKPYYAGHVLGAAMFHVRVGLQSLVYSGDYNMTPDRHLGAAWIDKCRPDLLITESTYATTIRDSKRCRERDFLQKIHDCVEQGGKVLIPVFALGRAQELCILLETYWERMNIKVPIFFSTGLTEKANNYYKMFITWTNEKIRKTFVDRNMFDFKHIKPFDKSYIKNFNGPMVVFATPGMLHGGTSLQIFEEWCTSEANMIIMPGYCVSGTIGHKILNGIKKIEIRKGRFLDVKMSVQYMSFSAHADAKGIMQLISYCEPSNVLLVHGEAAKMEFIKTKIETEYKIDCFMPANGETAVIKTPFNISAKIDKKLLKEYLPVPGDKKARIFKGFLLVESNSNDSKPCLTLTSTDEAFSKLGLNKHVVEFVYNTKVQISEGKEDEFMNDLLHFMQKSLANTDFSIELNSDRSLSVSDGCVTLKLGEIDDDGNATLLSIGKSRHNICISWNLDNEDIGSHVLELIVKFVN